MRNSLMIVVLGLMVIGAFGCQNGKKPTTQDTMSMDAQKDDCPFCPGIQHANADGTCPVCGMKVK